MSDDRAQPQTHRQIADIKSASAEPEQAPSQEVTKYELAEKNLQASEERLNALSRMMSDFAYSLRVEPDGSLVPEWMTDTLTYATGLDPEEAIALRGWMDVIHPDDFGLIADTDSCGKSKAESI